MSRTVDERIVEMRFDNKQFESNVATTLKTLEKLDSALHFSDALSGISQVGSALADVSFGAIEKGIKNIESKFSFFGKFGQKIMDEIQSSIISTGKKLEALTLGQITSGGWKRASNIEQAKFQLEGLAVEWDKIEQDISYSVKGTAFGLDSAARAAANLAASGIKYGKEFGDTGNSPMAKALRGISGVAAQTGSSFEDVAHIFTTVAGQGRVMAEQWNQLASRGMNGAAAMAKYLGKTEAEVREMTSKGEISFQQFAEAMDEAFGEHAKKANETYSGSLSNVRAALSRVGAAFATPYLPAARDVFNSLIPVIDKINALLKPLANDAAEAMGAISRFLSGILGNLDYFPFAKAVNFVHKGYLAIKDFVGMISDAVYVLIGPAEAAAKTLTPVVEQVEEAVSYAEQIDDVVTRIIRGGEFADNIDERKKQVEELGLSFELVQNKVNEAFGATKRYDVEQEVLDKYNGVVTESNEEVAETMREVGTTAKKVSTIFAGAQSAFNIVAKAATAIVKGFQPLLPVAVNAGKAVFDLATTLGFYFQNLEKALERSGWFETITKGVTAALNMLITVMTPVVNAFAAVGRWILSVGMNLLMMIANYKELSKTNLSVARAVRSIAAIFNHLNSAVVSIATAVGNFISKLTNGRAFKRFAEALTSIKDAFKALGIEVILKTFERLSQIKFTMPDISKNRKLYTTVTHTLNVLSKWLEIATTKINEFTALFKKKGFSLVVDAFNDFGNKVNEAINKIIPLHKWGEKLKNLIRSVLESIKFKNGETALSLITKAHGKISDLFKALRENPLGAFKKALAGVASLLNGIKTGKLSETIRQRLIGLYGTLKENKAFNVFTEGVRKAKSGLEGFLGKVKLSSGKSLLDVLTEAKEKVRSLFAEFKADPFAFLANSFKKLKVTLADLKDSVIGMFKKLTGGGGEGGEALTFGERIQNLRKAMADFLVTLKEKPGELFKAAIEKIKQSLSSLSKVKDFFDDIKSRIVKAIKNAFSVRFESEINFITTIKDAVVNFFTSAWKKGGEVTRAISEFVSGVIQTIKDVLPELSHIGLGAGLVSMLFGEASARMGKGKMFRGVANVLKSTSGFIDSFAAIADPISGAIKAFGGIGTSIAEVISSFSGIAKAVTDAIPTITKGLYKIEKGFYKIEKGYAKLLKGQARNQNASAILKVAVAVGVLAGSLWLVSKIDEDSLKRAGIAMAALAAGIVVLGFAIAKIMSIAAGIKGGKGGKTLADKMLETIQGFTDGVNSFLKDAGKGIKNFGKSAVLVALTASVLAMVLVVKLLGSMDPETAIKGAIGLGIILTELVVAFAIISSFGGSSKIKTKDGKTISQGSNPLGKAALILSLALASVLIVNVVKKLGAMNMTALLKGVVGLGVVLTELVLAVGILASTKNPEAVIGKAVLMASLAVASVLIVNAVKKLGAMPMGQIIKGVIGLGGVLTALVLAVGYLSKVNAGKGTLTKLILLVAIVASCYTLVGAIKKLGNLQAAQLVKGIVGLAAIVVALGVLMTVIGDMQTSLKSVVALLAVVVAINSVTGALMNLATFAKPEKLVVAALALDSLIFVMSLLMKAANISATGMVALVLMGALIGVLDYVLKDLSNLPTESALAAAGSLSLVMLAMAAVCYVLKDMHANALIGAVVLAAVAGITYLLVKFVMPDLVALPYDQNLLTKVEGVSLLLLALSGCTYILSKAGAAGFEAGAAGAVALLEFIAVIALVVAVAGGLAALVGEKTVNEFINGASNLLVRVAELLGDVINAFVTHCLGISDLNLGQSLQGFADDLSVFMDKLQPFLDKVQNVTGQHVAGATFLTAAIIELAIADFLTAIGNLMYIGPLDGGLVPFAETLMRFGLRIMPFLDLLLTIKQDHVAGAGYLSAAIIALAITDFITAVGNLLGLGFLGNGLPSFGTKLSSFTDNSASFFAAVKEMGQTEIDGVNALADMLIKLTAAEIINGVAGWIGGTASLTTFGEQLEAFGPKLKAFSESVDGMKTQAITDAATAAESLATFEDKLPKTGGKLQDWFGDSSNTLTTLIEQLVPFGRNLTVYSWIVNGANLDAVKKSADAAEAIANFENKLPKTGGLLQDWFGDSSNTLTTLIEQLVPFGRALSTYSWTVASMNVDAVEKSADAAGHLATFEKKLPATGGVLQDWFGENQSLKDLAENLKAFAPEFVAYSWKVALLNTSAVEKSTKAGEMLANLESSLPKKDGWLQTVLGSQDLGDFGAGIKLLGEGLKGYSDAVANVNYDGVDAATSAVGEILTLFQTLKEYDWTQLSSPADALTGFVQSFATEAVKAVTALQTALLDGEDADTQLAAIGAGMAQKIISYITATINGADGAKQLKEAGESAGTSLLTGIEGKSTEIVDAVKTIVSDSRSKIWDANPTFKSAAGRLFTNVKKGIEDKKEEIIQTITKILTDGKSKIQTFNSHYDLAAKSLFYNFETGITSKAPAIATAITAILTDGRAKIQAFNGQYDMAAKSLFFNFQSGIESKKSAILQAVGSIITEMRSKISTSNGNFFDHGEAISNALARGMRSIIYSKVGATMQEIIGNAYDVVVRAYGSFQYAGEYLVWGIGNGMGNLAHYVINTAINIASSALSILRRVWDERSPSHEGFEIGAYLIEGVGNGIASMAQYVYGSTEEIANAALDSMSGAVKAISTAINSDIDARPVIRPVIDLTDFQNGVGTMDSMLAMNNSTVGLNAAIRSVGGSISDQAANLAANGPAEELVPNFYATVPVYMDSKEIGSYTAQVAIDRISRSQINKLRAVGR